MTTAIVLVFLGSSIAFVVGRHPRLRYLLPLIVAGASVTFARPLLSLMRGEFVKPVLQVGKAPSSFGFNISFLQDPLSLGMGLLVLVIGFFVLLYSQAYFSKPADNARFCSHLLLFMGAMLGIVCSNNLLLLFVFWELTSLSSYLLIGFHHHEENSRKAALQALLVTGIGGLCLLTGLLVMYSFTGTLEIDELLRSHAFRLDHDLAPIATGPILLGALTKSAQFPFHFWLPNAMAAPSPASSYLHSATMVKAGIFLLLRLHPVLGGINNPVWATVLPLAGGLTLLLSVVFIFFQSDLKKILAYTTLAALGILTLSLGVGQPLALHSTFFFLVAHACYKAPLFLVVGNIDHECGSRDWRQLSGLRKKLPLTFFSVILCALPMASLPPFFSFIAKEQLLESFLPNPLALLLLVLSSSAFVYVVALFILRIFGGENTEVHGHEAPFPMFIAPAAIALLALPLSLFDGLHEFEKLLSMVFSHAAPGVEVPVDHLSYWHGGNLSLLLTGVGFTLGLLFYFWGLRVFQNGTRVFDRFTSFGPSRLYDLVLNGLLRGSKSFFDFIQNGYLFVYLTVIIIFVLFLLQRTLEGTEYRVLWELGELNVFEITMAFAIIGGALLAALGTYALAALAALGLVGFGIAFLYLINGAPDLALTQFLVETFTLVLLVLAFKRLPHTYLRASPAYAVWSSIVAGCFALFVSYVTLLSSQSLARERIREFYDESSLTAAHGRNVVNVILVDFRGIDTMGEISVLCLAAVGVYLLLSRVTSGAEPKKELP